MTIKAIETRYNGYHFRSRLEARWAVFFDELKIEYQYEPEGYELEDGSWYLPDFYLPKENCYFEIKGKEPTYEEKYKCFLLSKGLNVPVVLVWGDTRFEYDEYSDCLYKLPKHIIFYGEDLELFYHRGYLEEYLRFLNTKTGSLLNNSSELKEIFEVDAKYYLTKYKKPHSDPCISGPYLGLFFDTSYSYFPSMVGYFLRPASRSAIHRASKKSLSARFV